MGSGEWGYLTQRFREAEIAEEIGELADLLRNTSRQTILPYRDTDNLSHTDYPSNLTFISVVASETVSDFLFRPAAFRFGRFFCKRSPMNATTSA